MSFTNSPNMFLPIPAVGNEPGPDYANDVNNALGIIDQHNHAAGSGVQINPNGIDINTALTFNNNFATGLAGLTLQAQGSAPANNTVYESGVDLYFVDGLGNNIQLTKSGGVAGTPGSIANLVPPASATYVAGSQTFVWESDVSTAANMDAGAILLRNLSPNSTFAVTLQPPAALSSNYTLTLPALPGVTSIMALDSSGNMSAPYTVDNSTIAIISNIIQVKDNGITISKIAPKSTGTTVGLGGVAVSTVATQTISSPSFTPVTNLTVTITTSGKPVVVRLQGTAATSSLEIQTNSNSDGNAFIDILNGITIINETQLEVTDQSVHGAGNMQIPCSSVSFIDMSVNGVPGTYTYSIQAFVSTPTLLSFNNTVLIAYELS